MKKGSALLLLLRLMGKLTQANGIIYRAPGTGKVQASVADKKDWFVLFTRVGGAHYGECEKVHCGGALVAADMVLTAAHCFDTIQPDTAWVGRQSMCAENGDIGRAFGLQTVYPSLDYNRDDQNNRHDWALVRLVELSPATCNANRGALSDNTVFLTYGERTPSPFTEVFDFYGFGRIEYTGLYVPTSPVLLHANPRNRDQVDCQSDFGTDGFNSTYQFCTTPQLTCFGDSGGALVLGNDVVGIASHVVDHQVPNPDDYNVYCFGGEVYTNVTFYKENIFATICVHSASAPVSCRASTIHDKDVAIGRDLPQPSALKRMAWMALNSLRMMRTGRFFWGGDIFN